MLFENADLSIWITSTTIFACFIIGIVSCVCGCRKKIPKNELLGLAGLVKITNPDENVNFNTPPNIQLNSIEILTEDEINSENHELSKRNNNTVANATRSLPDLPVDSGDASEKLWSNTENNADTNSDLYATVEDANRKRRALTTCLTVDSSYTPSQTDDSLSPYARLKGEHSYDQLQQNEHPYARVGSTSNGPVPSTSHDATVNSTPSSHRTDRERADSTRSKSPSIHEQLEEIPAASAIAGSVPANHDLPYMTPPIPQQHFSGDSQDSGKGYTSISVREPLARILGRRGDPHYATVSDDSDEMYAAIEEKYTSGSETYAQISPPAAAPTVPTVLPLVLQHQQSIDGRSVSSDDSPRRERRPANSPLPEVPGMVDEMYAKVVKKRSPEHPALPSPTSSDPGQSQPGPSGCPFPDKSHSSPRQQHNDSDPNYQSVSDPNYQTVGDPKYQSIGDTKYQTTSDPKYQSIGDPKYQSIREAKYQTDSDSKYQSIGDPKYQSIGDPNYQTVSYPKYQSVGDTKYQSVPDPNYQTVGDPNYQTVSDPNYQAVTDPNYEELQDHDYASLSRRYEPIDPNYESVEPAPDPPYERVEAPDYELVLRQGGEEIPQSILELYAQVNKSPEKHPQEKL